MPEQPNNAKPDQIANKPQTAAQKKLPKIAKNHYKKNPLSLKSKLKRSKSKEEKARK